eukprot:4604456-Prymnesium_polylepis.1
MMRAAREHGVEASTLKRELDEAKAENDALEQARAQAADACAAAEAATSDALAMATEAQRAAQESMEEQRLANARTLVAEGRAAKAELELEQSHATIEAMRGT